ncbi:phosphoglycolate phosphatase [Oceanicoccus sp. KOV_DT_Chl]|uniref:phosphoglycolate phosphatase n=1 Tax=Oceanicoccus sp. KOV_DT_Chl TaxID=1904639 RepID=UPI00190E8F84|nr:phosphoglycolate phosphatase [Oceanicoccus sp. KOV_DT_Chl]
MAISQLFPESNPRAILFDLDGTLVDSVPDIAAAIINTLSELKLPLPTELEVRAWVGNGALMLVQRGLAWAKQVKIEAVAEADLAKAHAIFLHHYQQSNGANSRLYPGVNEALAQWQQQAMPMAVVTNKPIQFVPNLLAGLGVDQYFKVLVGGECVAERKPAPMMLLHACEQLGVAPAACLMVGDSRHDVQAAKAANIPVAAVNYGYNHGEAIELSAPNCVVANLLDLFN